MNCKMELFVLFGLNLSAIAGAAGSNQYLLKDVFKNDFLIGVAVSDDEVSGKDRVVAALIESQFNTITPENCLKWETVHHRAHPI
jgi:endo-1,4-beta-xylanase